MKNCLILLVMIMLFTLIVQAQVERIATFEDPNPRGTVTHYIFRWGDVSGGPYPNAVEVPYPSTPAGEQIELALTIAAAPGTYYAVVQAKNADFQSDPSNEASFTVTTQLKQLINLKIIIKPPQN